MTLQENINKQFDYYKRGLLTHQEMLENIIKAAEDEKPRKIEYRKGKTDWKPVSDTLYSKNAAEEAIKILWTFENCTIADEFRIVIA